MNDWDEPKMHETIIGFKNNQYLVKIEEDGCCELTNDHRIMYWKWDVSKI